MRSAATEGVRFCRSTAELREAFATLLGTFTQFGERNAQVLIRQCATGREYAVNTVSEWQAYPVRPVGLRQDSHARRRSPL